MRKDSFDAIMTEIRNVLRSRGVRLVAYREDHALRIAIVDGKSSPEIEDARRTEDGFCSFKEIG